MDLQFKAISLSHKNAPLEVRERFALDDHGCHGLLQHAKQLGTIEEMLVISTCNRFEVYFTSQSISCGQLTKLLSLFLTGIEVDNYLGQIQSYPLPLKAIEHLFRVSIGLESQVLGDAQIINQVKKAYQNSIDLDMAGPLVHRLMHTIFRTHKRIAQETCFKDCHASVTQVTKTLVRQMLPANKGPILILGTGKVGKNLCYKLSKAGYELIISNRTLEKSMVLATGLNLKFIPFKEVYSALNKVQLVISAVTVDQHLITKKSISQTQLSGHTHFIDLSVPRSIAPELAKDPNITLLNMEDINDEISLTIQKRRNEVPKVEAIIKIEISEFFDWAEQMKVLPTIHRIKAALERIRQEEIAKHLKKFDLSETHIVHELTKSIVDRVIKLPALKLKTACKSGEEDRMVEVLSEIFNI